MGLSAVPSIATFTGSSQYSQDLQNQITRSLALASLPLQQLQSNQATVSSKVNAEQSLLDAVNSSNAAVQSLASASTSALSASVSDQTVLQANISSPALPGTYTIDVTDPGSSTNALSNDGLPAVTDPTTQSITSSSNLTLTVGTGTFQIAPTDGSLQALANAINISGAPLQATIINIGGSTPDYRLALQATTIGDVAVQLNDGSDLMNTLVPGTNATYTVNGQPSTPISSSSSTVTIAPGLTANLQAAGSAAITVGNNAASVTNAIAGVVSTFNNVISELNKSRGHNAGPLAGESLISSVTSAIQQIAQYTNGGSGSVKSLADLGVEFTQQGTLTFDATKLNAMSSSQLQNVIGFLGNTSTGGFLQAASNSLTALVAPTTGLITGDIAGLNQEVANDAKQIQDQQNQLTTLQNNLNSQMAAADALITSLEQQTSFLTQLFATTNANNNVGQ